MCLTEEKVEVGGVTLSGLLRGLEDLHDEKYDKISVAEYESNSLELCCH